MVVPVCFFIAAWSYALCVNFVPYYRNPADAIGESNIGLEQDHQSQASGVDGDPEKAEAMQLEHRGNPEVARVGKD